MAIRSTSERWGSVAKAFHWLMALMLIGLLLVGWWMTDLPNSRDKFEIYALHKSTGLTVLMLVVFRILWRVLDPTPTLPPNTPRWQRLSAKLSHVALYAVMLAMPLSGWLYNSASNFPLKWFDLIKLPALSGPDRELKALAGDLHEALAITLVVLLTVHIGAALKHHFIDRDSIVRRMLPFGKP
jgi:cytochrome b561